MSFCCFTAVLTRLYQVLTLHWSWVLFSYQQFREFKETRYRTAKMLNYSRIYSVFDCVKISDAISVTIEMLQLRHDGL